MGPLPITSPELLEELDELELELLLEELELELELLLLLEDELELLLEDELVPPQLASVRLIKRQARGLR